MAEFLATTIDGELFKSKKAFKEAVENNNVTLTNVGIDDIFNKPVNLGGVEDIYQYLTYDYETIQIIGPDPCTNRKWYANVQVTAPGKVKVS